MARAVTSAAALGVFRDNMWKLSDTLHEVFDLMTADMTNIGQEWQDGQYEQYREAYSKQIYKCEDISVQYKRWCKDILNTTIVNVEAVEHTNVVSGGGSGSIGGGFTGTEAAIAGAAGVAAMGAGVAGVAGMARKGGGKFSSFNFGASPAISPASNQAEAQARWEEEHQMSLDTQNYYIDQNGNAVRRPTEYNTGAPTDYPVQGKSEGSLSAAAPKEAVKNANDDSTVSTYKRVCTTNKVDVYGTGATGKTCETIYPDGSKKTEIETCTQAGASVSGLGGVGAKSVVEGCKVTEKFTPAPSKESDTSKISSDGVSDNAAAEPVEVTGRRIVPRPKRDASAKTLDTPVNANPDTAPVDMGNTSLANTRNTADVPDSVQPTTNGAVETNASVSSQSPTMQPPNPMPSDTPNISGISNDPVVARNVQDHPSIGQPDVTPTTFPNVNSVDASSIGMPSQSVDPVGNVPPTGNTSINDTSVNNITENNTTINNITENNITENNITINNITRNNITQNNIIENTTSENTSIEHNTSHTTFDNNIYLSEPSPEPTPISPTLTSNPLQKDNSGYHEYSRHKGFSETVNRSDITDIPYTPFPESGNRSDITDSPYTPFPEPVHGPTGDAVPNILTDDNTIRRPSRIIGAFHMGKESPRNQIIQGNGTRQSGRGFKVKNGVSRNDSDNPSPRRRKDRFGK